MELSILLGGIAFGAAKFICWALNLVLGFFHISINGDHISIAAAIIVGGITLILSMWRAIWEEN